VQLLVQPGIERDVLVAFPIVDVNGVANSRGVIALERELMLAQLEGTGELDGCDDAKEERPGVGGQALLQGAAQRGEIEALSPTRSTK